MQHLSIRALLSTNAGFFGRSNPEGGWPFGPWEGPSHHPASFLVLFLCLHSAVLSPLCCRYYLCWHQTETTHCASWLCSWQTARLPGCFLPLIFIVNVLSQLLPQVSRHLRAGLGAKLPFISPFLWERRLEGPESQMRRAFGRQPCKLGSMT